MNRFHPLFSQKKIFVGYLTAGQRGLPYTEDAAVALVAGGVDILEIGIPFSDPIADGPSIQNAMQDALERKVQMNAILGTIEKIKKRVDVPIVVFGYYNTFLATQNNQVLAEFKNLDVEGILVVDLPLETSTSYFEECRLNKIEPISLIAPTTTARRIQEIDVHSHAFLYYVCRNGTTGLKSSLPEDYKEKMRGIKNNSNNPVVAGFGIGERSLAEQALEHADGFVVGSAFIEAITNGASANDLTTLAIAIDPR
jgi:tryptophan synthase alpha chain